MEISGKSLNFFCALDILHTVYIVHFRQYIPAGSSACKQTIVSLKTILFNRKKFKLISIYTRIYNIYTIL